MIDPKTLTPLSNLGLSHVSEMLGAAFWPQSSQYLCISQKQKVRVSVKQMISHWRRKVHQTSTDAWGLFERASSSWNNLKCQLDATRLFYWCILSSTCFGYIRPSSGALDVELQHMVFCTGFWMGGGLESCSGSQDHHPSKNSVQKTICCNTTSNSPDDGSMYPKHVELRIHQ